VRGEGLRRAGMVELELEVEDELSGRLEEVLKVVSDAVRVEYVGREKAEARSGGAGEEEMAVQREARWGKGGVVDEEGRTWKRSRRALEGDGFDVNFDLPRDR